MCLPASDLEEASPDPVSSKLRSHEQPGNDAETIGRQFQRLGRHGDDSRRAA